MGQDQEVKSNRNSKVRVNMWLPRHQHDELKQLAEYEGRSVSDIIRQLIASYLRDSSSVEKGGR